MSCPRLRVTPRRADTSPPQRALWGIAELRSAQWGGGLSATTVRYIHVILHGALSDGRRPRLVAENPASRAKPPKPGRPSDASGVWTAEELQPLPSLDRRRSSLSGDSPRALTGMRRGEVLGLRWGDVDLPGGRLVVRHTLVSIAYEVQESTPKTHRPRRWSWTRAHARHSHGTDRRLWPEAEALSSAT